MVLIPGRERKREKDGNKRSCLMSVLNPKAIAKTCFGEGERQREKRNRERVTEREKEKEKEEREAEQMCSQNFLAFSAAVSFLFSLRGINSLYGE